jgi:hypothetical protein
VHERDSARSVEVEGTFKVQREQSSGGGVISGIGHKPRREED